MLPSTKISGVCSRPRMWSVLLVLLLAMSTAMSCAHFRPARVAADVLMPPEQEVELGRQISAEIERDVTIHRDPQIQAYVTELGNRIVAQAGDRPAEIEFTFQVIDEPNMVNAFALPGGWIYVFSGMILAMDTEAELMAVLGHEVAHVTRRHIAQRLVTIYGLEVLAQVALGQDPGLLEQIVATVLGQGFLLRYSRGQESEADEVGVAYMVDAGYSPQGFIDFFEKLTGRASPPTFLLSHPPPADRIERVQALVQGFEDVPTFEGLEQFEQIKARLQPVGGGDPAPQ